ncbi:hypothetical protein PUR33_00215, partial [Streptomyces sp. BE282]|nr:hypothetical protein [Streptomyces sp. BE282]
LTALLAAGPKDAHDAYQHVSQLSQANKDEHRHRQTNLSLTPPADPTSTTSQKTNPGHNQHPKRAHANHGATPTPHEPPCNTPDHHANAVAPKPTLQPPEPT